MQLVLGSGAPPILSTVKEGSSTVSFASKATQAQQQSQCLLRGTADQPAWPRATRTCRQAGPATPSLRAVFPPEQNSLLTADLASVLQPSHPSSTQEAPDQSLHGLPSTHAARLLLLSCDLLLLPKPVQKSTSHPLTSHCTSVLNLGPGDAFNLAQAQASGLPPQKPPKQGFL